MSSRNYETKFEIKPGKFVYVPTLDSMNFGEALVRRILRSWQPDDFFYHMGKRGGHVAAMRPHLRHDFIASVDLTRFFPSVSRARIHRALTKIGWTNRVAFNDASDSCVVQAGQRCLPYGFVQSMALATLVVSKGALGAEIRRLRGAGIHITVYVDDILISANQMREVTIAYDRIIEAASKANFQVSETKSEPPSRAITAFNCRISNKIELTEERMEKFLSQLKTASENSRESILRYVSVLNSIQSDALARAI